MCNSEHDKINRPVAIANAMLYEGYLGDEQRTAADIIPSASLEQNGMLAGVILGKDASGQDIIPIRSNLEVKTNAHPNCDGTRWGWIEGCSKNICWSNENSKFNKEKADELVRSYNAR